jgi:hypothetical protein
MLLCLGYLDTTDTTDTKDTKDTIDTNLIGKTLGSKNQKAELLALQRRHYR